MQKRTHLYTDKPEPAPTLRITAPPVTRSVAREGGLVTAPPVTRSVAREATTVTAWTIITCARCGLTDKEVGNMVATLRERDQRILALEQQVKERDNMIASLKRI